MSAYVCLICGRDDDPTDHIADQIGRRCKLRTTRHLAYIADRWPLINIDLAATRTPRYGTPLRIHQLDLGYPPIGGAGDITVYDPNHDQHGTLPATGRLDAIVTDWANTIGERLPPPTVPALCAWIGRHLDWAIRHHPAIADAAREIRRLYVDVVQALNDDRRPTRYAVPCGRCGQQALQREHGSEQQHDSDVWIECDPDRGGCGTLWSEDELPGLARRAIPDDALLRAHQVADLLGISAGTVRSWASRGRLTADDEGRYRWGDVVGMTSAA